MRSTSNDANGANGGEGLIAVNGRVYRRPTRPSAVVCIDGCDPAYLEDGFARAPAAQLSDGVRRARSASARARSRASRTRTTLDRDRRAACRARDLRATTSSRPTAPRSS